MAIAARTRPNQATITSSCHPLLRVNARSVPAPVQRIPVVFAGFRFVRRIPVSAIRDGMVLPRLPMGWATAGCCAVAPLEPASQPVLLALPRRCSGYSSTIHEHYRKRLRKVIVEDGLCAGGRRRMQGPKCALQRQRFPAALSDSRRECRRYWMTSTAHGPNVRVTIVRRKS